jgi:hypothetical protein
MDEIPEKYRTDLAIIRETAEQINRDITVDNFCVVLTGSEATAFREIKDQLKPFLKKLFKKDKQVFQSMLYRIDISEKHYRKLLRETEIEQTADELAELIIRREFQKVLTRRFFSEKDK